MTQKVTMQQIADRLGLSKYTVSQALSGKGGISESTRKTVLETARTLGYRMRSGESNPDPDLSPSSRFVLVWIPEAHRDEPTFWEPVLSGIRAECASSGWDALIVSPPTGAVPQPIPDYVDLSRCAGIVSVGTLPIAQLVVLKRSGLPLILADHEEPMLEADCVVNDNVGAAASLSIRLLENGAKRLIYAGNTHFSISFRERWWGCRRTALEHTLLPEFVTWEIAYSGLNWLAELQGLAAGVIRGDHVPTGIVCANDQIAVALLGMLKGTGLLEAGTIRICGIDNVPASSYTIPALTTMDLAKESLGSRSVEALRRRMEQPGSPSEKIVLPARLIVRDSG